MVLEKSVISVYRHLVRIHHDIYFELHFGIVANNKLLTLGILNVLSLTLSLTDPLVCM